MAVAFFVVLGLFSFYRIGVELLPALNTPYVTVSVNYDGANAESIEQQVVKPMEDALSSVSNLKHMTSTASYGQARITLELDFSAMRMPRQSMQRRRLMPFAASFLTALMSRSSLNAT